MVINRKFGRNDVGADSPEFESLLGPSRSLYDSLPNNGLASLTFPFTVMNRPEIQKTPDGHPEPFCGKIEASRGYNLEVQFVGQDMWGRGKIAQPRGAAG
jgi:hypothetical protein